MTHRHPARLPALPTLWLMTDERQGETLWNALAALPRGSGVVFRHHRTGPAARTALLERVRRIARTRRLVVMLEIQRDGVISAVPSVERAGARSEGAIARVHTLRAAIAARRAGASAIFVSPVLATRSHPGQRPLGPLHAARIARASKLPAIALGGMNAREFHRMKRLGFVGWAAIDALTPADQKRKAVPI